MHVGRNGIYSRLLLSLCEFLCRRSAEKIADGNSNAHVFHDRATRRSPNRSSASIRREAVRGRPGRSLDEAAESRGRSDQLRLAGARQDAGANAQIGRTLASNRRAATERALDFGDGRPDTRQSLQLANGLEPLDRENDGRHDRLGGHESASKARIFAIARRGMPVVVRRLIAGVGGETMVFVERARTARMLMVATMRQNRMIVQRMDRRRSQQIAGQRQNNENPLRPSHHPHPGGRTNGVAMFPANAGNAGNAVATAILRSPTLQEKRTLSHYTTTGCKLEVQMQFSSHKFRRLARAPTGLNRRPQSPSQRSGPAASRRPCRRVSFIARET